MDASVYVHIHVAVVSRGGGGFGVVVRVFALWQTPIPNTHRPITTFRDISKCGTAKGLVEIISCAETCSYALVFMAARFMQHMDICKCVYIEVYIDEGVQHVNVCDEDPKREITMCA